MTTMRYKGYIADITFDADELNFFGKVKGIRQLVTFEADNAHDLQQAFHDSVDDYLAFCAEEGIEPDRPYKGAFNVRIDPNLHRQIAIISEQQGISLNNFVAQAILEKVKQFSTNYA